VSFNRPFRQWFPSRRKSGGGSLLEDRVRELERDLADAGAENARANEEIGRLQRQLDGERRRNGILERERISSMNAIRDLKRELADARLQLDTACGHLKGMEELSRDHAAALKDIEALRKKLDLRDKREKAFDRNSSSASHPFKGDAEGEDRNRKGGAPKGHEGHGRRGFDEHGEDVCTEHVEGSPGDFTCCPEGLFMPVGVSRQSTLRITPMRVKRFVLLKTVYECVLCGKRHVARPDDVLPRSLYSNSVICELLLEMVINFGTASATAQRLGMPTGSVFNILDRVATLFEPCYERILLELGESAFAHADETGWRIDGCTAYGWIFINDDIAAYLFRETRASRVPAEIFGYRAGAKLLEAAKDGGPEAGGAESRPEASQAEKDGGPEAGGAESRPEASQARRVIISDRYAAYNMLDAEHQYCYAHLLRDLEGIKDGWKVVPEEVQAFCDALAPLLAESMHLTANRELPDECYYREAARLKESILEIIDADARDEGIRAYQHIWRSKGESLFKWTEDRSIPCENNRAERALRPVVIARKTSFGSQGEKGRRAREILMTVLHTVKLRKIDVREFIMNALAAKVRDKEADLTELLKPPAA
jgi:transposase